MGQSASARIAQPSKLGVAIKKNIGGASNPSVHAQKAACDHVISCSTSHVHLTCRNSRR